MMGLKFFGAEIGGDALREQHSMLFLAKAGSASARSGFDRTEPLGERIPNKKNLDKRNDLPKFEILWRGDRDSNPRKLALQRFSRPPLSTAQPSPHVLLSQYII